MSLKEANQELEKLESEYEYWLEQKEINLSLVLPSAVSIKDEIVSGGKKVDRILKYVELQDNKKIDETLEYIYQRKRNLENWIDRELKILNKYNEIEQLIVFYKEITTELLTWEQISRKVHYSKDYCRRIYRRYKNLRNI